ncbi:site-specific integrase [Vibrio sp. TMPB1044]|uniref:tyrosine-type recombinase/integrase n=1 Tax=Vibrio sp. TMPB1044 TaxID=3051822 RepID=UPI00255B6848|nr:site-specific integrase [Vibrio sp. TMPB1044]MDL5026412.1 site-specific integrase [Vibrio sp. TMPB1044]MDN5206540.1 site-specific integrase [Vibrio sp. TMPB1044]
MVVEILVNVPVRLGTVSPLKSPRDKICMAGHFKEVTMPVLIGSKNQIVYLSNLFLINEVSEGKVDSLPAAKALRTWLNWLLLNKIDALLTTKIKLNSPTHGFRYYLLDRVQGKEDLSRSTANAYIQVIKRLYDWLDIEGLIDKRNFYNHKLSIIDGFRKIQSSDLAIQVQKSPEQSLSPLTEQVQNQFLQLIELETIEFQLVIKLMMFCGLRKQEALSFPKGLIKEEHITEEDSQIIKGIYIGPHNGVKTKFSSYRELFITRTLVEDILDYSISPRYRKRQKKSKGQYKKYPPLLNYSEDAFYSAWYRLKKKYRGVYNSTFNHKPHDLRATFATNLMKSALKVTNKNTQIALDITRYYMGHKREETTLMYLKFISRNDVSNQVATIMDQFVSDAIAGR